MRTTSYCLVVSGFGMLICWLNCLFSLYRDWKSFRVWSVEGWLHVWNINWLITDVRRCQLSYWFKQFDSNWQVFIRFFFLFISYLLFFRLLSSPTCPVLEALGKTLSYEIAVGLNGRVWVSYYHSWCYSVLIIGTKEKLL